MTLISIFNFVLVAIAFGFVIFWHELGHFLAARWAGVRVEQFAVGMGQALFSYRKGIGFRLGSTAEEFDKRIDTEIAKRKADQTSGEQRREWSLYERYEVGKSLGMGETEYRLSWIPLGGYVKPTGQDDLRPAAQVASDDPHAFGAKPVGKRMVIISAGVIMNVILAFALYVILFIYGFNSNPAVVGSVVSNSPAQAAGLKVGDQILTIAGREQHDYTKVMMNVALLSEGESVDVVVKRPGEEQPRTLQIVPVKTAANHNMPAIGAGNSFTLSAADVTALEKGYYGDEIDALPPGASIVKINGQDVSSPKHDYPKLDAAIQASGGKPVELVIRRADGTETPYALKPRIEYSTFSSTIDPQVNVLAGLQPRMRIIGVKRDGPGDKAGLRPGDVIEQLFNLGKGDALRPPPQKDFFEWVHAAGDKNEKLRLTVFRDGQSVNSNDVVPNDTVGAGKKYGLNVLLGSETELAVVGSIDSGSPAAAAGLKPGDKLTSIAGQDVVTWFDVLGALRGKEGATAVKYVRDGQPAEASLNLSKSDAEAISNMTLGHNIPLAPLIEPRQTYNPIEAAAWGYEETKFSIFQVYRTLRSLVNGGVPLSNLSGPLGIFTAGSAAADRGLDWLIWFTALISANLAVVNFLPIPIVDGGLFLFLLAEKFTGRPPSPRVQAIAQVIGLVLLGSMFLFVTYHDILRQWG